MVSLYNADCLTKLKDISSNSVDLIICDLPFGCLGVKPVSKEQEEKFGKGRLNTYAGCPWDVALDLEPFWKEIRRIRRNDNTPCLHFCTTRFGFELWESNKKEFRYDIVWDKGRGVSFLMANKAPLRSHEMVYVFSKAGAYYNRVDISGNFAAWKPAKKDNADNIRVYKATKWQATGNDGSTRCVKSVIEFPTASSKGKHPTEKPLELYKFLIERYCPAGGVVLDPTFGSCNSGVAARALGRQYIGIEKDETFYKKGRAKMGLPDS